MSSYWDNNGQYRSIGPCAYCRNYGHWDYQCSSYPQYHPTPYNDYESWNGQHFSSGPYNSSCGYEGYQDQYYDRNCHEFKFQQDSQNRQGRNDENLINMMQQMLDSMKEMTASFRTNQKDHNERFNEQMSLFWSSTDEHKDCHDEPSSQALDSNNDFDLQSINQNPDEESVDDELYTWNSTREPIEEEIDDTESLLECPMEQEEDSNMGDLGGADEPIVMEPNCIYTELEFDNSEVDEDESLVQKQADIDSTLEDIETVMKVDTDDSDEDEMSSNVIEEYVKCAHSLEKVTIVSSSDNAIQQNLFEFHVMHGAQKEPTEVAETEDLWHKDVLNPSRKGWDLTIDESPLVHYKVLGNSASISSHGLKYWKFYHLPVKLEPQGDCFENEMVTQQGKCGDEKRSCILGFGDDRSEVAYIVTWYKDRGKMGLQHRR